MEQVKEAPYFKKKNAKETVTPHRLTVAILIRDFCDYRELGQFLISISLQSFYSIFSFQRHSKIFRMNI